MEEANPQEILLVEKREQELESYQENKINWLPDDTFFSNWDGLKGHMKKMWRHKESFIEENWKKFFLAYSKDTIKGKPQLIDNVQRNIPLVRLAINKVKNKNSKLCEEIGLDTHTDIQSFFFFDEKFDKRHDGFQQDCLSLDFWCYRIVEDGKEYFIWTQTKLPNEVCTFRGMLVELDDLTELNRNLKIKSISKVFFMKEFEPSVKILTKEQIITYTKERQINEDDWFIFLAKNNKFGTYNFFPKETEYLKSAVILSGKQDGYPLHWFILGPAGTHKTMGIIEALAGKFSEEPYICEASNSRLKGLEPSFKEKPANVGYLAKANRVGFIDELLKMVEAESQKSHNPTNNMLGNLNFLLEHKARTIFSGFDSDVNVQANSKFIAVSNPISNKPTIYAHVGILCPTFMSRGLWSVQDKAEQEFILKEGVFRPPRTPTQEYIHIDSNINLNENRKKDIVLKMCSGKYICKLDGSNRSEFLTLFDTCYSFLSEIDDFKINQLVDITTQLAREPMKSSVWKPRAYHHITLLVDGLCKHRCLFKDYDSSFIAKEEDYKLASDILIRMINSWNTDLSPKEDFKR